MIPFVEPSLFGTSFNCPHCLAHAQQVWGDCCFSGRGHNDVPEFDLCWCTHCKKHSIWRGSQLIFPEPISVNPPNDDLDADIKSDYIEAAAIVYKSPRGAAALYRLCIQKLCKQLGEKGDNINTDIASLVSKGLNPVIQKSLDIVRVLGNEAVHPGQVDLRDDHETAKQLAKLINIIAETMITQPKIIGKMYSELPQGKIDQIKKRDGV